VVRSVGPSPASAARLTGDKSTAHNALDVRRRRKRDLPERWELYAEADGATELERDDPVAVPNHANGDPVSVFRVLGPAHRSPRPFSPPRQPPEGYVAMAGAPGGYGAGLGARGSLSGTPAWDGRTVPAQRRASLSRLSMVRNSVGSSCSSWSLGFSTRGRSCRAVAPAVAARSNRSSPVALNRT
jgi:hypothetical protein